MEWVARKFVLPLISRACESLEPQVRTLICARILQLPKSKRYNSAIEHMLQFMPTMAAEVEVQAISGLDTSRKDSSNDFFDREILVYAFAYAGTLAAIDRWIASLVAISRKNQFPAVYGFAGSLDQLGDLLDRIC